MSDTFYEQRKELSGELKYKARMALDNLDPAAMTVADIATFLKLSKELDDSLIEKTERDDSFFAGDIFKGEKNAETKEQHGRPQRKTKSGRRTKKENS